MRHLLVVSTLTGNFLIFINISRNPSSQIKNWSNIDMFNRNKVIPDKNILIQKPDSFIKNDQDTHKEH